VEQAAGLEAGRIGIEAQIEDARGLAEVDAIAAASPRLEALVFGPADFMASIGMRSLQVGAEPAAIDGPHLAIADTDGLRRGAASAAALGYDGKWVLHPGQVDIVNQAFSPDQASYDRAELILDAYAPTPRPGSSGAR